MKKLFCLLTALVLGALCLAPAFAAEPYVCTLSAPSGAPALAVAVMAAEDPAAFTFVAADAIAAEFASRKADFIIAPVNAGARLFKAGKSAYRLAAVVTWGNLYFAAQKPDFTAQDMNGADITLFGEGTINASVALYALAQNGITPASVTYLAGAANTQSLLLSDPAAIVLTAEPALTAARIKNDQVGAVSLNELYEKASGSNGFAQAGLFVNPDVLENHPEEAAAFLARVEASCGACADDVQAVADAAVKLEILPNAKVALQAIPGCAIRFIAAADARALVEQTAQVDLSQFGGELPADGFYYAAE